MKLRAGVGFPAFGGIDGAWFSFGRFGLALYPGIFSVGIFSFGRFLLEALMVSQMVLYPGNPVWFVFNRRI